MGGRGAAQYIYTLYSTLTPLQDNNNYLPTSLCEDCRCGLGRCCCRVGIQHYTQFGNLYTVFQNYLVFIIFTILYLTKPQLWGLCHSTDLNANNTPIISHYTSIILLQNLTTPHLSFPKFINYRLGVYLLFHNWYTSFCYSINFQHMPVHTVIETRQYIINRLSHMGIYCTVLPIITNNLLFFLLTNYMTFKILIKAFHFQLQFYKNRQFELLFSKCSTSMTYPKNNRWGHYEI